MKEKILALRDCALMLGFYLLIPMLLMIIGAVFTGNYGDVSGYVNKYGNYYLPFCAAAVFAVLAKLAQRNGGDFWNNEPMYISAPWLLLLLGASLNVFITSVLLLMPDKTVSGYMEAAAVNIYSPVTFLILVFVAPVSEEILFRGFLQTRLLKAYGVPASVAVVSLVFGLLHIQILWIIYAAAMGVVLSLVALRRGILSSIIVHIAFNLTNFVQMLIVPNNTLFRVTIAVVALSVGAYSLKCIK